MILHESATCSLEQCQQVTAHVLWQQRANTGNICRMVGLRSLLVLLLAQLCVSGLIGGADASGISNCCPWGSFAHA